MTGTNKFHLSATPPFVSTNALLPNQLTRPMPNRPHNTPAG